MGKIILNYKSWRKLYENKEIEVTIPNLDHLLRHSDADKTESGSKMSQEILDKAIEIAKERILNNDFDKSSIVSSPARWIMIDMKEDIGLNALMKDEQTVPQIWDKEFEFMNKNMKEGIVYASYKSEDGWLWQKRENAEIPVLVNTEVAPVKTQKINVIVGPEKDGKIPIWTIYPGEVAPMIAADQEEFWKNHYFAGKELELKISPMPVPDNLYIPGRENVSDEKPSKAMQDYARGFGWSH